MLFASQNQSIFFFFFGMGDRASVENMVFELPAVLDVSSGTWYTTTSKFNTLLVFYRIPLGILTL
jgi:hypothetical protein